jgi:phosphoribosyl 1,2-cyclic phosphodiesterase
MRLVFLGTRGEIEERSKRHWMHTSLLIARGSCATMIDCGRDWASRLRRMKLDAIVLTHAHSDHAGGLKTGSNCPVFATADTWERLKHYRIADQRLISADQPFRIGQIEFEAASVEHSLRAPAVGFGIQPADGGGRIFYAPDVAAIPNISRALANTQLYIGDGATFERPILRERDGHLIGHASMASQLNWCAQAGVSQAIFSHCGSQIVTAGDDKALTRLRELGRRCGISVRLAHDGLCISL